MWHPLSDFAQLWVDSCLVAINQTSDTRALTPTQPISLPPSQPRVEAACLRCPCLGPQTTGSLQRSVALFWLGRGGVLGSRAGSHSWPLSPLAGCRADARMSQGSCSLPLPGCPRLPGTGTWQLQPLGHLVQAPHRLGHPYGGLGGLWGPLVSGWKGCRWGWGPGRPGHAPESEGRLGAGARLGSPAPLPHVPGHQHVSRRRRHTLLQQPGLQVDSCPKPRPAQEDTPHVPHP